MLSDIDLTMLAQRPIISLERLVRLAADVPRDHDARASAVLCRASDKQGIGRQAESVPVSGVSTGSVRSSCSTYGVLTPAAGSRAQPGRIALRSIRAAGESMPPPGVSGSAPLSMTGVRAGGCASDEPAAAVEGKTKEAQSGLVGPCRASVLGLVGAPGASVLKHQSCAAAVTSSGSTSNH
jgi:hypothetical protein